MDPRDLMRNAKKKSEIQRKTVHPVQKNIVHRPETKSETTTIKTELLQSYKEESSLSDTIPSKARFVAREDVSPDVYGVNPWKSNFDIYDKNVARFIRNFSQENRMNGGKAITKSQLIETILNVMIYDVQLKPIGFQSTKHLREYLYEILNIK